MTESLTVLECEPGNCAAKVYGDPNASPKSYNAGSVFRIHSLPIEGLASMAEQLDLLGTEPGVFVVRGEPSAEIPEGTWVQRLSVAKEGVEAAFRPCARRWLSVDADETTVRLDPADLRGSVQQWRDTLPEGLREAGMIWQWSASSHRSPFVRGHAWFWLDAPAADAPLRAWATKHGFDPAFYSPVQPHYTAAPVFDGCADPFASRALIAFEGPDAILDLDAALGETAVARRGAPAPQGGEAHAKYDAMRDLLCARLGDPCAHKGNRRRIVAAIGGLCRRAHVPAADCAEAVRLWLDVGADDIDVAAGVRWALGAYGLDDPDKATGIAELRDACGDAEAADAIRTSIDLCSAWGARGVARLADAGSRPAKAAPAATAAPSGPPTSGGAIDLPDIVHGDGLAWVLGLGSEAYIGPMRTDAAIRNRLKENCVHVQLADDEGKMVPVARLMLEWSIEAEAIEAAFYERETRFDVATRTIRLGYHLPDVVACEDAGVAQWLAALFTNGLDSALDWIAACRQDRLQDLTAALVIVGPKETGKTLLFQALASLWGEEPVALKDTVQQFNSSLGKCPLWLDDEAVTLRARKLPASGFLQLIQARSHLYEPKGQEKRRVHGCARVAVTANAIGDIGFADVDGRAALEALADRMSLHTIPQERQEEVRSRLWALHREGSNQHDIDVERIARHLAWVQATRPYERSARFVGSYNPEGAIKAVLSSGVSEHGPVFDLIEAWFASTAREDTNPALAARGGRVYCFSARMAQVAMVDVGDLHRALAPFKVGSDRASVRVGKAIRKAYEIDVNTLGEALELDPAEVARKLEES